MTKCTKCGEEIKELTAYSHETNKYTVTLTEQGTLEWGLSETVESSATKDEFQCPLCEAILFTTDGIDSQPQDVIEFLKGEKNKNHTLSG